MEAKEEFMVNQKYGLFEFNRTIESITQFIESKMSSQRTDQSQSGMRTREPSQADRSLGTLPSSVNSRSSAMETQKITLDEVNGIDMEVIFEKQCHSPETQKERNKILTQNKMTIVGKGRGNERIQEYRPSQQGHKQVEKLNTDIYNRFFHYCEDIGTTSLQEYQRNNLESWLNSSDGERQVPKCQLSH